MVISRKFSAEWKSGDKSYYPVNDEKNQKLYTCHALADVTSSILFGWRLDKYKYYDINQIVKKDRSRGSTMFDCEAIHQDQLYKKLMQFEFISFDIFDTLVKRDVASPDDIFVLVQKKYNLRTEKQIEGFWQERKKAEKQARVKSKEKEITLDEIYEQLPYPYEIREILKSVEIDLEESICTGNIPIVEVYNQLIKNGKKIYLISDMYLPENVILHILDHCGIKGYEKLFLSSKYRCRKRNGLFRIFLNTCDLSVQRGIHVGDDIYADCISIIKETQCRMQFYKIPKVCVKLPYFQNRKLSSTSQMNIINSFIKNRVSTIENSFYKIGYSVFGPILLAYTQWLEEEVKQNGYNKVLFLARDAYVIQKAVRILRKEKNVGVYFCVSRNSIIATLLNGDYSCANALKNIQRSVNMSIEAVLKLLNAYGERSVRLARQMGIDVKKVYFIDEMKQGRTQEYLNQVLAWKKNDYINERTNFEQYLLQFICNGDRIAAVDVGWNGTTIKAMQLAISDLGVQASITGLFMGINRSNHNQGENINLKGLFFPGDCGEEKTFRMKAVRSFLEYYLTAPHGTTLGYKKTDSSKMMPLFKQFEFSERNGKALPEFAAVKQLQAGSIAFLEEFSKSTLSDLVILSPDEVIEPLFNLCTNPMTEDLRLFGNLRYFNTQLEYMAKPRPLHFYLFHYKALKHDFSMAGWKLGFMRRLFHNLPIPYYRIYTLLLTFYHE